MSKSHIIGNRAVVALEKMGDIVCPENGDMPAFSRYGCIEHIDKLIVCAPKDDIKSLNMVLAILSFMPGFVLRAVVRKITASHQKSGGLSTIFRLLDFAIKGIILATYYSGMAGQNYTGKKTTEIIDFEVNRFI